MEEDLADGVTVRFTKLLAGKDVTVIESAFENPPDDPFHCPPAMVEVRVQRDGLTSTLHRYYAPLQAKPPTEGP
jgi:RNA polymerase sigma-70 factor (ECF subfamily)